MHGWRKDRGGRWGRREERWKGINDTKTAIPTFRPCTALRGRIREYRVRTFDTVAGGRRELGSFTLLHANQGGGRNRRKEDRGETRRRRLRHVNEERYPWRKKRRREGRRHVTPTASRAKRGVNAITCNYVSRGCNYTVARPRYGKIDGVRSTV